MGGVSILRSISLFLLPIFLFLGVFASLREEKFQRLFSQRRKDAKKNRGKWLVSLEKTRKIESAPILIGKAILPFFLCALTPIGCSRTVINLTPDVIRDYGLDQVTIPNVQFYYRAITIHPDSSVTHDEPTVFRRIDTRDEVVTETQSPAAQSHLAKSDIVLLENGTPCKVDAVLDSGRTLRADFGSLKLNFALSYRSGYNFRLISDTAEYQGKLYVRSQQPLLRSIGILSIDRKELQKLTDTETRIRGKRVEGDRR
jgi:hypothetical protein